MREEFLKRIGWYLDRSTDTSYQVLSEIYKQMDYRDRGWSWSAIKANKDKIAKKLNISTSTLDKKIKALKDRKFIIHDGRSVYTVEAFNFYELSDVSE